MFWPFTVLKHIDTLNSILEFFVTTVLTVYGIETEQEILRNRARSKLQQYLPFTVLKLNVVVHKTNSLFKLQQYLPFTVLKPLLIALQVSFGWISLQQYLPFTVLKR